MKKLPKSIRIELRAKMSMHKFTEIKYLQKYINEVNFIHWISRVFKTLHTPASNNIYKERTEASKGKICQIKFNLVFFIVKGKVAFVLPS
jgi:hypothetical protein